MIGDDVLVALDELRAQAESLMLATGTVSRTTGMSTDTDGREVPDTVAVYSGPARLMPPAIAAQQMVVAGATVTVQRHQLHFPVGSFRMQAGDVWTCTANPADPTLAGRKYRLVAEAPAASLSVAYRLLCEEAL